MVVRGRKRNASKLNGHGHGFSRLGRPRPDHYSTRKPRQLVAPCRVTTGWSAISNCSLSLASITTPEGLTESLVKLTGSGDNAQAVFDMTIAPMTGAQAGRDGIEFDCFYTTSEPYSDLGNSGISLSARFTDFSNTVACTIQIRQGWQRIRLKKADFVSTAGTGNWDTTNFSTLRWVMPARAGVTHAIWFRDVSYMATSKPLVCVQFDDNGLSVYENAFPLMRARGIPGSVAVISDSIGQSNWNGYDRMTASQMREMMREGWDFVNHTKSHQQNVLPTASQQDCEAEIVGCRDSLIANGLANGISEHLFCAPYGEYGTNYRAGAVASGCLAFRGTVGDATANTPRVAESDCLYDPLVQIPTTYVTRTQTPASILDDVDSLIDKGGLHIPLFHHTPEVASVDIEYQLSNFETYLDGLVARRNSLDFGNFSDAYLRFCL